MYKASILLTGGPIFNILWKLSQFGSFLVLQG